MNEVRSKKSIGSVVAISILALSSSNIWANMSDYNLNLDANIELDSDALKARGSSTEYSQGGRVEVNFMGERYFNDYFIRAKGTGLLRKSGDTDTDDMWLMFGSHTWALQAGRFEAKNLFPLGKDTLVYHAGSGEAQVYQANLVRGRVSDGGQFAYYLTPSENVAFELATQYGGGDKTTAISGVRPAITFGSDTVRFSLGLERLKFDTDEGDRVNKQGFGASVSAFYADTDYNLSFAQMRDKEDDNIDKVSSVAANFSHGPFGAGVIYSVTDRVDGSDPRVATAYAAYTLPLFDIQNANVTFAGSLSRANNVSSDAASNTAGLRMRFNYTF